jgi:nitrate/nitrite transporter NarK
MGFKMENIKKTLRDSRSARWTAMVLVSFAMFVGYLFTEILSPLKSYVESSLGWSPADFGAVTGGYGLFNVFLGALVIVGIMLDRYGIRLSAILSAIIMLVGAGIKYYALTPALINGGFGYGFGKVLAAPLGALLNFINMILSFGSAYEPITMTPPVALTLFGYALFGIGVEYAGITASKAIVKWFKGKEMALAMGLQVALGRLGSFAALFGAPFIVESFNITTPFAIGVLLLTVGLLSFIAYNMMDVRLDKEDKDLATDSQADKFSIKDIGLIVTHRGFWYITLLCLLFYSAVFPFYKFGPDLMVNKFGVAPKWAGLIPSLVPLGTIILTPLFGRIYDRKGKGASIMILGSFMLIIVHVILFLPFVTNVYIAALDVILLGIAFSLVPSAMWPSVPKLLPEKQLGTAFALTFWIQNWGLTFVPIILGIVLKNTNPEVVTQLASLREKFSAQGLDTTQIAERIDELKKAGEVLPYDYFETWLVFICLTLLALVFAFLLKAEDKKKNYGLQNPNIQD